VKDYVGHRCQKPRAILPSAVFFYPKEKFVDRQALASMLDKKKYFPANANEPTDCNIAGARAIAYIGGGQAARASTLSLLLSI